MTRTKSCLLVVSLLVSACGDTNTTLVESDVECGAGTHLEGQLCVPDESLTCGEGTRQVGDECVPDEREAPQSRYEVRVAATEISSDGYSKLPVFAIGTLADGTPSQENVLFGVSSPGFGTFTDSVRKLSNTGATTFYTACNSAIFPGCDGPFQITLALANAPESVVAMSQEIRLVAPEGVGSMAGCAGGGSVLFLDGDEGDWVHPWIDTIVDTTWSVTVNPEGEPDLIDFFLRPTDPDQGSSWNLEFSSQELGQPLQPQVYGDAQRFPFEDLGRPGFNMSGDGRGCNQLCARYQIHELEVNGAQLQRFAATFEQNCECGSSTLRGCVYYEAL
ncbi:MAG: hypothetical protein OES69_08450 [Myxococcales bacterium]|nr:hypothetical protein [Myxococcales bacterium]MDH3843954.1 hypothetical protein [Myxococcales bacterium]